MTSLDLFPQNRQILPLEWLSMANERRPVRPDLSAWFSGTTHPKRQGWYERHFTDSEHLGDDTMHWWDGRCWRSSPNRSPHWLQVGDYPAWRGEDPPVTSGLIGGISMAMSKSPVRPDYEVSFCWREGAMLAQTA